ncbi:XdhC/CoxI family protein [Micromonospora sp. WMMD712]|uniref:XdhC family protein n=1 Tax=Micromonospora sp. WMMD712 TaxID=3016096 RepID=UPI00249BF78C|nr:XdhC/CoxI family protein [Micromonospora sp. WMMD712]WFE60198.1 XdhC family protein [Micromonospora sp. WMMD712]
MRDVLPDLLRWWQADEPVGLATVIRTWRSAPRQAGAALLVGPDDSVVGSVSGGCVEGAVYELCREVVKDGTPRVVRFGVSDDESWDAGLTCGGTVELYVERVDRRRFPDLDLVAATVAAGRPVATATCVDGPPGWCGRRIVVDPAGQRGTLGTATVDAAVAAEARALLRDGRCGVVRLPHSSAGPLSVMVVTYPSPARMLVFGATDFAAAVTRMGRFLGYRVTVCDARPVFATARRFPQAHEVVVDWPHRYLAAEAAAGRVDERTVVCVLTHDPRFDVPVLKHALELPLAYVGALGSRRTAQDRRRRLREVGVGEAALGRLAAPMGLDLGGHSPEETALSIAAEIVAVRGGGGGASLSRLPGRIHHQDG